jgi:hypothetical protein
MTRFSLLLLVLAALSASAQAQSTGGEAQATDTTAATADADWLLLPFASYSPDTKLAGGVVGGYYRSSTEGRPGSSVQATLTVTQRRQVILQATPELYLDRGQWRVQGDLQAAHFPNSFYGIGGDTPASAEEAYTARYALVDAAGQWRLRPHLRVGPRLYLRTGTVMDPDSGGLLAQERVPGADGGLTAGLGGTVFWDARNSLYYPTAGTYADLAATLHSAAWGSEYTFAHLRADVRGYRSVGWGVVAGQVYAEGVVGDAPFELLPLLGGPDRMRGYREGRFRDHAYWTAQVEYRVPLFWRFKATAFASVGEVGPRVGAALVRDVEAAVGLGGRLRLTDDGVHGRVDVAYSRTGPELYLSLGEAF